MRGVVPGFGLGRCGKSLLGILSCTLSSGSYVEAEGHTTMIEAMTCNFKNMKHRSHAKQQDIFRRFIGRGKRRRKKEAKEGREGGRDQCLEIRAAEEK